ncbi:MAG: hypothetical protein HY327_09575 [Chloroflexi bacterium]|nr:hypothetical protein [Chloroflexota bacterium]
MKLDADKRGRTRIKPNTRNDKSEIRNPKFEQWADAAIEARTVEKFDTVRDQCYYVPESGAGTRRVENRMLRRLGLEAKTANVSIRTGHTWNPESGSFRALKPSADQETRLVFALVAELATLGREANAA